MPSILGGLLSILITGKYCILIGWHKFILITDLLIVGIASKSEYDQFNAGSDDPSKSSLYEIFPLNFDNDQNWSWSPG